MKKDPAGDALEEALQRYVDVESTMPGLLVGYILYLKVSPASEARKTNYISVVPDDQSIDVSVGLATMLHHDTESSLDQPQDDDE